MAACIKAVQQPDGSLVLRLDPTATDLSTCQYVVQSGAELANSLFSLSAEDGSYISAMIVSVWAAAWGVRAVINVVQNHSGSSE